MRYKDFKIVESRKLFEAEQQKVYQTLDNIEQTAEDHPEVLKLAKDAVKKAREYAAKVLAKQKAASKIQQSQESIKEETLNIDQELSSLREDIAKAEADIAAICQAMGDACLSVIANIQKFLESAYQRMESLISKSKEAGAESEFQSEKEFAADFDKLIKSVAAKATGTLEALESHYEQQAEESPDREMRDVKAPKQTQVEKAVEDTIRSVFSGPAYNAETREEKIKTRTMLKNFLSSCVKGIIKLGPMLDKGQGNIITEFKKTKYGDLTEFFNELLGKVPSGSGAGSWGPAELALSVVGTPVNKAEKGDLNIGGNRKIELKASRTATKGGRVNTPALGTGNSGKGEYDKAFKPFAEKLGLKVTGGVIQYIKQTKTRGKKIQRLKYTSWGPSLINNVLNPAIKKKDIDRGTVIKFVENVAVAPVIEDNKKEARVSFNSQKVVKDDATIDAKAFVAEYLNMAMGFYAETDGVEEILVINPVSGNFHVVDARKTDTLHDKIANGDIELSSSYIDFTDTQSKAGPQIGTK